VNPFTALVTFLPVADLEVAHEFYADGLGLALAADQGSCRIYRVAHGGFVGICEHLGGESGRVITTLVTDDVDGWYQRLADRGVLMDSPPQQNTQFGIYHFFVDDPSGNRLEVQRFDPPGLDAGNPADERLP
jgi:predicted enzyme related to lactoylglutathione lyase